MKTNIVAKALLFTCLAVDAANALRLNVQDQQVHFDLAQTKSMEQRKIINNRIDPANMPLSTKGKLIVDKNGDEVRLACVNWYGAHMERYVVNGLDLLPMDEISNDIANDGFNCVRLPFSLEQFFDDPVVSADAVMANPDLKGKTSMEIFDATIKSLAKAGLMVILNNHNSDAMWCCSLTDGNGYWHTDKYPTHKWEEALLSLTRRYQGEPMVVGNDLRNEVRGLMMQWDRNVPGMELDWKYAAEKMGKAIQAVDPDLLIIVEGLNFANDMSGIKRSPIKLDVPNKLVYSAHYYSWEQITVARWDGSYQDFKDQMNSSIAFMLEEGHDYTAPLWIGEIGTNSEDNYWRYLIAYLSERTDISWAYWAYNGYTRTPEDNESFGLTNKDMKTVRHDWKLADLQKIQKPAAPQFSELPYDVANHLTMTFLESAYYAANLRMPVRPQQSCDLGEYEFRDQMLASGVPKQVIEDILDLGESAAYLAANTNKGLDSDAETSSRDLGFYTQQVRNSGWLEPALVDNIKQCASSLSWYYSNSNAGKDSQADLESARVACSAMSKSPVGDKTDKLPFDAATLLIEVFQQAAHHTANERKSLRKQRTCDLAPVEFKVQMLAKAVPDALLVHIIDMGWSAAWYAANTQKGYDSDARTDQANLDKHLTAISNSGKFSQTLVDNMKQCAEAMGRFYAHLNFGKGVSSDLAEAKAHCSALY